MILSDVVSTVPLSSVRRVHDRERRHDAVELIDEGRQEGLIITGNGEAKFVSGTRAIVHAARDFQMPGASSRNGQIDPALQRMHARRARQALGQRSELRSELLEFLDSKVGTGDVEPKSTERADDRDLDDLVDSVLRGNRLTAISAEPT